MKQTNKKHPLAYARVIDKIKLPEEHHKGKKILDEDRQHIRELYQTGNYTYRQIMEKYNVAYGVIQCIINPRAYKQMIEAGKRYKEKNRDKINKQRRENHNTMELRRRKKQLIIDGKIKLK